ncbi:MAG: amidohydrolase family protein [Pseudomonadales bacterium]|nr:amidohydrolase family protein [Pseudomonadales bacterium]
MSEYDLHIRNGTVVDGTRVPRYKADIWIKAGKIVQIGGRVKGKARQEIDATGHIVAPGFIDLHTHYDAQIRWDPWCTISGWHGVTSVVLGNCGFGFAPVKPEFRDRSMLTMTRTEAIPYASMQQGMEWDWETIPEYLDSLERAPKGVNCLQYMPTASLMTYVMGLEAAKSRPASEAEKSEMKRLLHEGMDAGLCGFSIQRLGKNSTQADFDGTPMVTDTMVDDDIFCLAEVLAERDEGFIQITQATGNNRKDLEFQAQLARVAQRPILHNAVVVSPKNAGIHERRLAWLEKCRQEGLQMYGQGGTLRGGFAFTLEDWNLYDASRAWRKATTGTHAEKLQKLADPDIREAMRQESMGAIADKMRMVQAGVGGPMDKLVIQDVKGYTELEKYVGKSVAQIAIEEDKHVVDAMLDIAVASNLEVEFLGPDRGQNADHMAAMINDSPYTFPGVSDGGAHTKFFTGGSFTTDFLMWLTRDEPKITLEEAHYRLSALPAHAAGFRDRGTLRVGAPADVVVYDLDKLDVSPRWTGEIAHDFPAGEWRRIQKAIGYRSIVVNGEITFMDGECTGATPGKLLRHGYA